MNIQRSTLLTALDRVLPATGDSKIEGADAVVFSDGWAHTYRDDMSISAPVPDLAGLTAAVKAKDISKVVKKLRGDVIEVSKTDTSLVFVCGTTEGEIVLQPDTLSHALASLKLNDIEWSEVPTGFRTAVALCRLENHREQFPVVHFTDNLIIAVTTTRWNFGTVHGDPIPSFSIHTEGAKVLLTMGDLLNYSVGEFWAHWQTENGSVFSAKTQDAAFPMKKVNDVYNTIQTTEPVFIVDMPKDLGEKVGVVSCFSAEDQKSGTPLVDVTVTGNEIRLASGNSGGKVKDKCILDAKLPDGVETTFGASVPYLEEAAKRVQTMSVVRYQVPYKNPETKEVVMSEQSRLVFKGQDFTQIVTVATK